jgi:hypothetical protein
MLPITNDPPGSEIIPPTSAGSAAAVAGVDGAAWLAVSRDGLQQPGAWRLASRIGLTIRSTQTGGASPVVGATSSGIGRASVSGVEFSRELRNDVLAGDITVSVRLWKQPRVKRGGRYRVGLGEIEVDEIELLPFAAISAEDVRRAGEPDRETLRRRAAHAGPIDEDTLVYRVEFHAVGSD